VALCSREQVARRAFECLRQNAQHVRYWDQYALNTLFSGRWKPADPRWNQNTHVFRLPTWELSHYTEQQLATVKSDPWIIHFDYKPKPWQLACRHPLRAEFFKHLDQTWWHDWRPKPPLATRLTAAYRRLPNLYHSYRVWRRRNLSPAIRTWKKKWLGRTRKAA
jgi:lipopolysaccharide biosynthesis glycosyltransferase